MPAVIGRIPLKGKEIWGRHTRKSETCGTEGTNATRDGNLVHNHRLLQLQHFKKMAMLTRVDTARQHSCYRPRNATVLDHLDPGEIRMIACSSGVQQGGGNERQCPVRRYGWG